MSRKDRDRWNQRYRHGAYKERNWPSSYLVDMLPACGGLTALDLACGRGRNSLYLAKSGYETVGLDISDVAIDEARTLATEQQQPASFQRVDLEEGLALEQTFDLIIMFRYVDLDLVATLPDYLNAGGTMIIEEHLRVTDDMPQVTGPTNPNFRVQRGSLRKKLPTLRVRHSYEGLVTEPNGESAALARITASKD